MKHALIKSSFHKARSSTFEDIEDFLTDPFTLPSSIASILH